MIFGQIKMDGIVKALTDGGLFENHGMIELKKVEEACTYLGG